MCVTQEVQKVKVATAAPVTDNPDEVPDSPEESAPQQTEVRKVVRDRSGTVKKGEEDVQKVLLLLALCYLLFLSLPSLSLSLPPPSLSPLPLSLFLSLSPSLSSHLPRESSPVNSPSVSITYSQYISRDLRSQLMVRHIICMHCHV